MTDAERAARAMLDERLPSEQIPVPVDDLATECGAQLVYEPFEGDVSGMILRDRDRVVIAVNADHSSLRQRFTIAHELGHMMLHEGRPLIVDSGIQIHLRDGRSSQASSRQEIEANRFAAELLMPAESIGREARTIVDAEPNVKEDDLVAKLADAFEVSKQSMTYRLMNLGILSPLAAMGGDSPA